MSDYLNKIYFIKDNILVLIENFNFIDFLDIFFVFLFLFFLLYFFKKVNLHKIVLNFSILLILIYFLSLWFKFLSVMTLIKFFLGFLLIFFVIIFQKELRRLLYFFNINIINLKIEKLIKKQKSKCEKNFFYLVEAIFKLVRKKEGALIVLKRKDLLDFLEGGVEIYAQISVSLILSIFDKNSPLHDGALILDLDKGLIEKASVILPLSDDNTHSELKKFGTRHRAAIGLSERTDAIVIVVSEEKGIVTICENGHFISIENEKDLLEKIKNYFGKEEKINYLKILFKPFLFFKNNFFIIFLASIISLVFWGFNKISYFNYVYQDFQAPVVFNKMPNDAYIEKLTNNFIDLTLLGSEKDFKFFKKEDIRAVIDFNNLVLSRKTQYVKIEITPEIIKYPSNLKLIKYKPKFIEFKLVFEDDQ